MLAQWGLIPRLGLDARQLVIWGSIAAAVGTAITGVAGGVYGITLGYAIASLGFGLFRPGFTAGASLAVPPDEQNAVAGMVTSINGLAYIAAPTIGVAVYGLGLAWPFLGTAALMLGLAVWTYCGSGLRPPRREHARLDEADAAGAARLLLQALLDAVILILHLGRHRGAGVLQRVLEMRHRDLGRVDRAP